MDPLSPLLLEGPVGHLRQVERGPQQEGDHMDSSCGDPRIKCLQLENTKRRRLEAMEAVTRPGIHPQRFEVLEDVVQNVVQFLHEQRVNVDAMQSDIDEHISRIVHVGDDLIACVGENDVTLHGEIADMKKTTTQELELLNARVEWPYRNVTPLVGRHEASPSKTPHVPLIQQMRADIDSLKSRPDPSTILFLWGEIKSQSELWVHDIVKRTLESLGIEMRTDNRSMRKTVNGDMSVAMSNLEAQLNKRMDSFQSFVQTLLSDGRVHTLGERVQEIQRNWKKMNTDNESFTRLAGRLDTSYVPFETFDNHSKSALRQVAEVPENLGPKAHGKSNETLKHDILMQKEALQAGVRDSSAQYIARLGERVMHKLDDEVEWL